MHIETLDHRTISEADARAVAELIVAIWPKVGRTVESLTADIVNRWKKYSGPAEQYPRSFIVRDGRRVIAHASFEPRTIATSEGDFTVLALARVCTDPQARGRRLGEAVVRRSFEVVDQGAFPFGLFQTTDEVRPFYEKLGAVTVDNHFVNSLADDPAASPWWNPAIMRYPGGPAWPAGKIDLRGPGW